VTHFTPSFTYNTQNTSASVLLCSDLYMCLPTCGTIRIAHTTCPALQTLGLQNFVFTEITKYKHKMSNMVYKLYHRLLGFFHSVFYSKDRKSGKLPSYKMY
jgi:hypothetical protein